MVQQMQSQCDDCGGSGDFIREKDRCKKCKGKRLIERDHKLEVCCVFVCVCVCDVFGRLELTFKVRIMTITELSIKSHWISLGTVLCSVECSVLY